MSFSGFGVMGVAFVAFFVVLLSPLSINAMDNEAVIFLTDQTLFVVVSIE